MPPLKRLSGRLILRMSLLTKILFLAFFVVTALQRVTLKYITMIIVLAIPTQMSGEARPLAFSGAGCHGRHSVRLNPFLVSNLLSPQNT